MPHLPDTETIWARARTLLGLRGTKYSYDVPLQRGGRPFATIRVCIAGGLIRDRVAEAFRQGTQVGMIQIALALAFGILIARGASRRLRALEHGIAALRDGRFENRIPESGVDEFSRLARDLNLLGARFQREQQDRDVSLGSFHQTVELLGEGVLTLGGEGEVILMNGAAARILGVDAGTARGQRLGEILPRNHPVAQLAKRLMSHAEPDGDETRAERRAALTSLLPDEPGKPRYVAVGHRVMGAEEPVGVLIEFKEAQALEILHSLADQSRVLSRLGQMAAGVAHEIRNPLQTINLELGILRGSRNLPAQEVELHVRTAQEEIQRLQRAVSGFLKVARLRPLAPAPLQLNELLREVHESMEAEANLAGLDLELHLEEDLPIALADREVLRQAAQNLVKNAIQALPSKRGTVRIESCLMGREIHMSVVDGGPGIPPEIASRVFDLYFTTKEGGTGVGLSLVRQAVEMHGGEVEIQSGPDGGTRVTLRLPVRADVEVVA
jgi:signal transduction histidine kinase